MYFTNTIYTPITLKDGEPLPANACIGTDGRWYIAEQIKIDASKNPFKGTTWYTPSIAEPASIPSPFPMSLD